MSQQNNPDGCELENQRAINANFQEKNQEEIKIPLIERNEVDQQLNIEENQKLNPVPNTQQNEFRRAKEDDQTQIALSKQRSGTQQDYSQGYEKKIQINAQDRRCNKNYSTISQKHKKQKSDGTKIKEWLNKAKLQKYQNKKALVQVYSKGND